MKTVFLFLFGMSFSILGTAQEVNQFDENGERHGPWKKYFPGTKQLRYEGQFDHGKETGTFKFYCEECGTQPMVIKEFNPNDNSADVKYYTVKGKLVSEGKMEGKNRIGEWVYYHKRSKDVMTRENYVAGNLDGVKTTYYTNGKVTEETTYVNGVEDGPNNYYSYDGVLLKKLIYAAGELHGPATYYNASGSVSIEGQYKEGKKHGLWKYYKGGKVVKEETFPKPVKRGNKG